MTTANEIIENLATFSEDYYRDNAWAENGSLVPLGKRVEKLITQGRATVIKGSKNSWPIARVGVKDDDGQYVGAMFQKLGYQEYPMLDMAFDEWRITAIKYGSEAASNYIKGTLTSHSYAYVKDEGAIFIDAMLNGKKVTEREYEELMGFTASMKNGGYKMSKRYSRWQGIFKPYQWAIFDRSELTIVYNPELDEKEHDGIIFLSPRFMGKMERKVSSMPRLREVAKTIKKNNMRIYRTDAGNRLEATVMADEQQLKGHAIQTVSNHVMLDGKMVAFDIMVPAKAGKPEIAYRADQVFVGLKGIKGHDHMALDFQSLVNLVDFFGVDPLLEELKAAGSNWLAAIENGDAAYVLDRSGSIDKLTGIDKLRSWVLADFCTSGGDLMWFAGMVRKAAATFEKQLSMRTLGKHRFPVLGGRWYIAADSSLSVKLQPGHARILDDRASLAVPAAEYVGYIQKVLGGCDGDDGVWVRPFTDHDGLRKLLIWRSPNGEGEYIVMLADSYGYQFSKYPEMDSRKLPPRIDTVKKEWQHLPAIEKADVPDQYRSESLIFDIMRAENSAGNLGTFINTQMAVKMHGWDYDCPFPQEEMVDYTVKDGGDTTPGRQWAEETVRDAVIKRKLPVSRHIIHRIAFALNPKEIASLKHTEGNWIDVLLNGARAYLDIFKQQTEMLAAKATPPMQVWSYGKSTILEGSELRQSYRELCRLHGLDQSSNPTPEQWSRVLGELYKLLPEGSIERQNLLLGVAASIYAQNADRDTAANDGLLWMSNPHRNEESMGSIMVSALRRVVPEMIAYEMEKLDNEYGIIKRVARKDEGGEVNPTFVKITGMWYYAINNSRPVEQHYYKMGDVPKGAADAAKARVDGLSIFENMTVHFGKDMYAGAERVVMYNSNSKRPMGLVSPKVADRVALGVPMAIKVPMVKDGEMVAVLTTI